MKSKHYSLAVTLLSILTIAFTLWMEFATTNGVKDKTDSKYIKPLSDISVPSTAELSRIDQLERNLNVLATPPPQYRSRTDLAALGYLDVVSSAASDSAVKFHAENNLPHRLTLAFDGRAKRFCVIDSRLYPEGALLPDGSTILKIESRRVLIAKKSIRQWLTVEPMKSVETQARDS